MSISPRIVDKKRQTSTALPLYYSGHLLKKMSKEIEFKKYYAELRGTTIFLYENDTQDIYTERLDLELLKSMDLMSPYQQKAPTIFTLSLYTQNVQLTMENADTAEEWRGYILTVVKREIPTQVQLLPGQIYKLNKVLDQEKLRNPQITRPALPPRPAFLQSKSLVAGFSPASETASPPAMPECFFDVNRREAERMLEANCDNGGIILRPSTLANSYALTIRMLTQSGPVLKNFRVTGVNLGFVIELDTPVKVSSLNDVIKYFVEQTEYRLHPYTSQQYDTSIEMLASPRCISSVPPRVSPKAQVAPMPRTNTREQLPLPPIKPEESEYVIPDETVPEDRSKNQAQVTDELNQVLKFRRENIYQETGQDVVTTYDNETRGTAQWSRSRDQ